MIAPKIIGFVIELRKSDLSGIEGELVYPKEFFAA